MKHRSAKKSKEYVLRRKLVEELLAERPGCEACAAFATFDKVRPVIRPSVDVHEIKSRGRGGSILDKRNLITVCRFPCHSRITTDATGASEMLGLMLPSWAQDEWYEEAHKVRISWSEGVPAFPSWMDEKEIEEILDSSLTNQV